MKIKLGLILLLILLLPASMALAKGRQPDKAIITGPNLVAPIIVTNPQTIESLWRMRIPILPNIEKSYAVSFFQQNEQGKYTQFYSFNYYPEFACEYGLIYDPTVQNISQWYIATPKGEATAKELIKNRSVSGPQKQPILEKEWKTWAPWVFAFAITLANGIVTGRVLRRRPKR